MQRERNFRLHLDVARMIEKFNKSRLKQVLKTFPMKIVQFDFDEKFQMEKFVHR